MKRPANDRDVNTMHHSLDQKKIFDQKILDQQKTR
jgi:hypothetical protein